MKKQTKQTAEYILNLIPDVVPDIHLVLYAKDGFIRKISGFYIDKIGDNANPPFLYLQNHLIVTRNNLHIDLRLGPKESSYSLKKCKEYLDIIESILYQKFCCDRLLRILHGDFENNEWCMNLENPPFGSGLEPIAHCPFCGKFLPKLLDITSQPNKNRFDWILHES